MVDNKEVMDWANSLCARALTESRDGNPALANRIGANQSLSKFFNVVHATHAVSEQNFPDYYRGDWKEIRRLYEAYTEVEEQKAETQAKFDNLEARFDKLESMLTAFMESQKQPAAVVAEEAAPAKNKGGKKPAKTEVVETETVEEVETPEAETPVEETESEA